MKTPTPTIHILTDLHSKRNYLKKRIHSFSLQLEKKTGGEDRWDGRTGLDCEKGRRSVIEAIFQI